jgi:redox-sensitive bicupin YhaK (pirin superfamily)
MSSVLERRGTRAFERASAGQLAAVGTFTVRRALPERERHSVGPWVFLDHFGPFRVKPGHDGVGAHPHAGIETVTYLMSGRNEHRDSAGHQGIVGPGGAQWMTSGRGIVHAERPLAESEAEHTMHGIQLWTTLPRAQKLMAPRYQRIDADAIPEIVRDGVRLRVIAGAMEGATGPAEVLMPLVLAHLTLEPGAAFETAVDPDFELAAYVIEGEAGLDASRVPMGSIAFFAGDAPRLRIANAGAGPLQVLVLGGTPAEGPLVFHGPFVMNSVEQVRAAEVAYRTGRMGVLDEPAATA